MRATRILSTASAMLGFLLAGTAHAQSAGIYHLPHVDTVSQYFEILPANTACTFTFYKVGTTDPDPNLIVDAFAYPSGAFLQEGTYHADNEFIWPARLQFSALSLARKIVIVVRGTPGTSGTFQFVWEYSPTSGPARFGSAGGSYYGPPSGGTSTVVPVPSGMPTATHVFTVEERGGTYDTILMVLGQGGVPIAYDDDSGLAMMSWLHLHQPCPPNFCSILVARALNGQYKSGNSASQIPTDGSVKLFWDADMHNGRNRDEDGLGDGLEVLLGTCDPNNPNRDTDGDGKKDCDDDDVDGDGLEDSMEVIGRGDDPAHESTTVNLTKLPYWGADPLVKDLFVEADWMPGCNGGLPACPPNTKNRWQLTSGATDGIAAAMASVARVHIDTGNGPSADPTISGDWGGAELLPDNWGNYCRGASPVRDDLFYHVMASDGGQNEGRCSRVNGGANANAPTFAHETGHYFGLQHWGKDAAGPANCKPQHVSVMNYAYSSGLPSPLGPYSSGAYANLVLNPTKLDEYAGIGAANASGPLAGLVQNVFGRTVTASGAVDWNMDDVIAPQNTTVKGVLNYAGGGDCDREPYAVRETVQFVTALRPTIADTDLGLMMLGLMRTNTGVLDGRLDLAFPNLGVCGSPGSGQCATFERSEKVSLQPRPGLLAPAAAGGIVVYADANGMLYYFKVSGGRILVISAPKAMGGGAVSAAPIAVKDEASGRILVFAPRYSGLGHHTLVRWEYDPVTDLWWVSGSVESWTDLTPVLLTGGDIGLGITKGRLSTDPPGQTSIFAAIPAQDPASGKATVEIARLERTGPFTVFGLRFYAETWSKLDPGIWTDFSLTAGRQLDYPGRIGLAYRPEGGDDGRFYLAFKGGTFQNGGWVEAQFIAFTRGNVPWNGSGSRPAHALAFATPTFFYNEWGTTIGGLSLATFNGSIRAIADLPPCGADWCNPKDNFSRSSFFPNADGIYNMDQTDFDEVTYVARHMACALRGDCTD